MKKLSLIVATIALTLCIAAMPAGACEGENCEEGWVGGDNLMDQWQDFGSGSVTGGGYLDTSGGQNLDMWGAVHVHGGTGEYQSFAGQSEGLDLTKAIPGGEIAAAHLAMQEGAIDITGGHARASVWGENEFSQGTAAGAESLDHGAVMWSENHGALDMNGEVCLRGSGEASYLSEVIQQTGHSQELDFDGGSGFTQSLSQQRGFIDISTSND